MPLESGFIRKLAATFFAIAAVAAAGAALWKRSHTPRPPLTAVLSQELVFESYRRYAAYQESYMDADSYLSAFPTWRYKLHETPGYARFYLDDIDDGIKYYLRRGERWEPVVAAYLGRYVRKSTNVLDVGAHVGTHTIWMDRLLDGTGTVYAFEPQKKLFVELVVNLYANEAKNVRAMRYALGSREGVIEMNEPPPGNEGATRIGSGGDRAALTTIDSLALTNVSLVKIDVEGFEEHVLLGARETIDKSRPVILLEIMGGHTYKRAPPAVKARIDHTRGLLEDMGYSVRSISAHDYLALPSQVPDSADR